MTNKSYDYKVYVFFVFINMYRRANKIDFSITAYVLTKRLYYVLTLILNPSVSLYTLLATYTSLSMKIVRILSLILAVAIWSVILICIPLIIKELAFLTLIIPFVLLFYDTWVMERVGKDVNIWIGNSNRICNEVDRLLRTYVRKRKKEAKVDRILHLDLITSKTFERFCKKQLSKYLQRDTYLELIDAIELLRNLRKNVEDDLEVRKLFKELACK